MPRRSWSRAVLAGALAASLAFGVGGPPPTAAAEPCEGDAEWTGAGDGFRWSDRLNWRDEHRPGTVFCTITVQASDPGQGTLADGGPYGTNALSNVGALEVATGLAVREDLSLAGGSLVLGAGVLDIGCDCSVDVPFLMKGNSGILRGSGHVTFEHAFTWAAGRIESAIDVADGSIVDGDATPLFHALFGTFTIPAGGVVRWTGSGDIGGFGGTFVNRGLFKAEPAAGKEIRMIPDSGANPATFRNDGTISKVGGGRAEIRWRTDIGDEGDIDVEQGQLAITGYGQRRGPADVGQGATLEFGDRLSTPSDGRITEFTGPITGHGTLEFTTGNATHRLRTYAHDGPVGITGSVEFLTGDEVTLATLRVGDPANASIQGTLGGSDPVKVMGQTTLHTAVIRGSNALTALGGLVKAGTSRLTVEGRTLRNGGAFDWQGGQVELANGGTFEQLAGGTLTIDSFRSMLTSGPGFNDLVNRGLIRIRPGGELDATTDVIGSGGELRLEGGTLTAWQGVLLESGTITGSGTVRGGVTNTGGIVTPGLAAGPSAGLLTLAGPYTQAAGGRFALEIGGAGEAQRDRLAVSTWAPFTTFVRAGNLSLAGRLDVSLIDGYVAPTDTPFPFISFDGTRTGALDVVAGPDCPAAIAPTVGYASTSVFVTIGGVDCPEPEPEPEPPTEPEPEPDTDTATVAATVTVDTGAAPCIQIDRPTVSFGTLEFGATDQAATPSVTITNCSTVEGTLLASGTDAAGPGSAWTLVDGGTCAAGLDADEYRLRLRSPDLAAPVELVPAATTVGALTPGQQTTHTAHIDTACPGSSGQGQTMTLSITYLATAP